MKRLWPLILQLLIWVDIIFFFIVLSLPDHISETSETGVMVTFGLVIFCVAFLLLSLPFGIIGLLQTRRKPENIRFLTLTYWISFINICIGSLEVLALIWTIANVVTKKI